MYVLCIFYDVLINRSYLLKYILDLFLFFRINMLYLRLKMYINDFLWNYYVWNSNILLRRIILMLI